MVVILCGSPGWGRSQPCTEWTWQQRAASMAAWLQSDTEQSDSLILPWCLLFLEGPWKAGASGPGHLRECLCEKGLGAGGAEEDALRALVRAAAASAVVPESVVFVLLRADGPGS